MLEKIRENIADAIFPLTTKERAQAYINKAESLAESYNLPIGGASGGVDEDDWLFRSLTAAQIDRSLQPIDQDRLIKNAVLLWMSNPLAFNAIEMTRDYVVGEGFNVSSTNEDIQTEIDSFWYDQTNNWELYQGDRFRDLMIFGEFIPAMFPNPISGHTKMGLYDPLLVDKVVTNPENIAEPWSILFKTDDADEPIEKNIIRLDEDGTLGPKINPELYGRDNIDTKGRLVGDIFYFPLNKLQSATRGRSTLLAVADWLDAYDRFIFNRVTNISKASTFIWDITCTDYNQKQIDKFLSTLPKTIKSGSYRAHDQNIKWEAVFPNFNSTEAKEEARLLMGMILAGVALPEHWLLGQGADVNRASALAMGNPTFMRLQRLQKYMAFVIRQCIQYHLDHVAMFSSSKLQKVEDSSDFEVTSPPINVEDIKEVADTLASVTNSLVLGSDKGWIEETDAAQVFCTAVSRLGHPVDPPENIEKTATPAAVKNAPEEGEEEGV